MPARTPRLALALGLAGLAGWALLAVAGGGIDPGDGLGGAGPTGAFLALALGAPAAAAAAVVAWDRRALRSGPARLALVGAAGSAAWAGLSITWAAAPDLAWIDANRQAIVVCALVGGLALGALLARAPALLGLGLAAAAALPVALALGTKIVPGALGSDRALARLADPVGYWNALALVVVMAVPGVLWLAGGIAPRRWALPVAGAAGAALGVTLVLTYSRGGILSLLMAVGVTLAFVPRRVPALAVLLAGMAGAAWPAAYGLTEPLLSSDGVPADLRAGAGAGLGWRLALGMALAALLAPALVRAAGYARLEGARARRVALAAAALACAALVVGAAASPSARGWAGDRAAELRGDGGDALANDPGRLVSAAGNQRGDWWGEAWRGWLDAPLLGQGAGGFRLVHLKERRVGDDALNTREPHQVVLRVLSGTGVVGLALFAALVAGIAWGAVRAVGSRAGPEVGLPLAVMAAFALQAAIDWSWAIPALTVPAVAAGGIVLAAAAPGHDPAAARRPPAGAAAALAGVAIVAAGSALMPWLSDRAVAAGREDLAAGRPQAALDRAAEARARNPLSLAPLRLRGEAHLELGDAGRALGAYEDMTRVQPDNPAAWRGLAVVSTVLGDSARAGAAWREVLLRDPRSPGARAGVAAAPPR